MEIPPDMVRLDIAGSNNQLWIKPNNLDPHKGMEMHFVWMGEIAAVCFRLHTLWTLPQPLAGPDPHAMRVHWREEPPLHKTIRHADCPLLDGDDCWLEKIDDGITKMVYREFVIGGIDALWMRMEGIYDETVFGAHAS